MGEDAGRRKQDIAALRLGIELGMTLIDTAEMYADGGAETVVGEALTGRRDGVFVVTKVTPGNATRRGTVRACERSLRRLRTSHIDLYLLHWPADAPIAETVAAFDALMRDGKIRYWGVSNLDLSELEELTRLPTGGACASDQVLYNLRRRGIEWDLLPWCAARQMPVMAYSPIDQGELLHHPAASELASRYGVTASQIALAWTVRKPGIIAIPKAGSIDHVRDNHGALGLHLDQRGPDDTRRCFPPADRAARAGDGVKDEGRALFRAAKRRGPVAVSRWPSPVSLFHQRETRLWLSPLFRLDRQCRCVGVECKSRRARSATYP